MIEIHAHRADSSTIDIIDVKEIRIKRGFETDEPVTCFREIQIVDEDCRVLTLNLYAKKLENLKIKE
jgi:hypothetical protein